MYVDSEILDVTKNRFLDCHEICVEPVLFETCRRMEAIMVLPGGSQRYQVSVSSSDKSRQTVSSCSLHRPMRKTVVIG